MSISEREGVIKFDFEVVTRQAVTAPCLAELGAWRAILRRLGLLGCDAARYDGVGFGNVSYRASHKPGNFYISGSQTGQLAALGVEHWVEVLSCEPETHFLQARGLANPSAESMTHAAVYAQDRRIRCVLHGHSPELWRAAERLALPTTRLEVAYGTPEMAREVGRLFAESMVGREGVFAMAGHEDGVVAFGRTAEEAGKRLVAALARSLW